MSKVLLTNAQLRKTLSAVRSLGARGIYCDVAETTKLSPAAFSKHTSHSLLSPNPSKQPKAYQEWLVKTLREGQYDVFFPMDDDTMAVAVKYRDELEPLCSLPLPPTNSYEIASDKGKTALLAKEAGIPCPKTMVPASLEFIDVYGEEIGYPLVVKPRHSSGSRGIRIVPTKDELMDTYLRVHDGYAYPILQEYIPQGDRFDVCLLYNRDGILRYSFIQKELRHFPIEMGPSTVQESVWYPELLEYSKLLMQRLPWYGVVELEFMIDPRDGQPKLMEINPRFWNSIHLAFISGVDFVWGLYQAAMGRDVEEIVSYRLGVRSRGMLPGDLLHFAANPNRWSMEPPFLGRRTNYNDDIWSLADPMPALGFAMACLRYSFDFEAWRMLLKR